jgi:hypothetical protein
MLRSLVCVTVVIIICILNKSLSAANGNHEETLTHLIKTTEELVCNHVGADASVMTSIAQRVDPGLKNKGINRVSLACLIFLSCDLRSVRVGKRSMSQFYIQNYRT